jgi:hypothetical protein
MKHEFDDIKNDDIKKLNEERIKRLSDSFALLGEMIFKEWEDDYSG